MWSRCHEKNLFFTAGRRAAISSDPESPPGFALVATLSMMVLVTVIAVGLFSLSTNSLRQASTTKAKAEAQANARLALMLAIGELQKQLGPDTRVSITADQRMTPGGDGAGTSSAPGNRHWTGVFDSWPATADTRPNPDFRSWLVSGDRRTLADAATPLDPDQAIELVGPGTVGDGDGQVLAPPAFITSGSESSRMAWWVGDQGVKAAISTRPATRDTSSAAVRLASQGAPRNAFELAGAGSIKLFAGLASDDPRIARVTSWKQSVFLATDIDAHKPLFHDLAATSTGLLTNVRAGGFRRDLSMKLESFTSPPDLARVGGQPSPNVLYYVQNEEGINFQELWSYYHLYKQLQYGGGGTFTTGGAMPATAPYLRTADSLTGLTEDHWDRYNQPITVSWQIVLSFEVAPAPADRHPGAQALHVSMDPVVTLWNPLDVAVDISPETATGRAWMYVFWVIPYDINVRINGGDLRRCSLMRSVYNRDFAGTTLSIDYNMIRLNAGLVERITLRPGEVLRISQTGNTISGNGGFRGLDGRKGFNYGGGTRFPLLDDSGQYILLSTSDSISYSASPNNLTAGRDPQSGGNIIDGFSSQNSRRWSMTHNSLVFGSPWGQNVHIGQVSVDHCYGYNRTPVGQTRALNNPPRNKTLANSQRVFANSGLSDIYPVIDGPQNTRLIPANSIIGRKAPFMVHSYNIKTEVENDCGGRSFARFNPKAHNVDFYNLRDEELDLLPYQPGITPLTSWLNAPLDLSVNGRGFFGSSLAAEFGSNFVNTHSVPRQPIVSLAAFQDSFANGFNRLTETIGTEHANARMPLLPQISHAIGNSLAPSLIAQDQTEGNLADNPRPLADHSYLANRALFDDWFLSGIAPQPTPAFPQFRDLRTVATEFFTEGKPLPVARYMPALGGRDPAGLVESFFSGSLPTETAINHVASHLRVDGMFNVNSTSVEAWKTVLAGLKGRPIVVRDENGVESISAADADTPVVRIGAARDIPTTDASEMSADQWQGRRSLTDEEIDQLARAIVREVRKRGPFLSLSDFVNRRVGRNRELAKSGAIQSALDSPDVAINRNQNTDRAVGDAAANRFVFPEAEKGPMAYGAPSLVKQGDILTPISPVLSARSDSFIVRAYGETTDKSGKVTGRAWCEAVVERDRDYIDPADASEILPAALTRDANRLFGRRFNVVSFRWLNPGEI